MVYKVDRLSRSLVDFAQVMEHFTRHEVGFVSVTQHFSTTDPVGRLTLNMLMSFAEFEREMIGDRIRDKIRATRRKGQWTGGHAPLGYRSEKSHLLVHEEEAPWVKQVFDWYLEGVSALVISQRLNALVVPLKSAQKPRQNPWTKDLVLRILRNRLYLGELSCEGEYVIAEHTALIGQEVFDRAQEMLEPKVRRLRHECRNPIYLIRGTLKCGLCGASMTSASTFRNGHLYRYYRCSTRDKQGKKVCPSVCVGNALPDVAKDLPTLVDLRTTGTKVSEHQIGEELARIWKGKSTDIPSLTSLIALQDALESTSARKPWTDSGFNTIARGACGHSASETLATLRRIRDLDSQIEGLAGLHDATDSLWRGLESNVDFLGQALEFREEVGRIRASGAPEQPFEVVGAGGCGPVAAHDWVVLRQRTQVERGLAALGFLESATDRLWRGLATSTADVKAAIDVADGLEASLSEYGASRETQDLALEGLQRCLTTLRGIEFDQATMGADGTRLLALDPGIDPAFEEVVSLAMVSSEKIGLLREGDLSETIQFCQALRTNDYRIKAWCAWRKVRIEAEQEGLEPLVQGVEGGSVPEGSVRKSFEVNHARWWINSVVDADEVIRGFVSAEHEKRIRDFRALDDEVTRLTKLHIRAKLCAELPGQEVPKNSEWGVLRREMNKKKRHMPLRELITELPTALTKLTPCLLMSPLSIAQYLPANSTPFDVVIFDEPIGQSMKSVSGNLGG